MILRQVLNEDLGCASYLVGDPGNGVAAIVDPQLDVDPYLRLLSSADLTLRWVLQTHTHADHVSGHAELIRCTGARLAVPRTARWEADHRPVDDGEVVRLGQVELTAVATPGHRPEHMAYLIADRARSEQPWAVLTGDSLLVGDVARPDLATESTAGARALYASLQERLLTLPDSCEVWPGHVAGSLCGSQRLSGKPVSTIAFERAHNPLLVQDRDGFVELLAGALPARPPHVETIVGINRSPEPPAVAAGEPLSATEVKRLLGLDTAVIDTRTAQEFCEGHIPGACAVPAGRAGLGTRVAQLVEADRPIIVIAASEIEARGAIKRIQSAGCLNTLGWLEGGQPAWHGAGWEGAPLRTVAAARLHTCRRATLVDVREPDEFALAHLPGAVNLPLSRLHELEAPPGPLTVVCATGRRALTAASLLAARGSRVAAVVDGGVDDVAGKQSAAP